MIVPASEKKKKSHESERMLCLGTVSRIKVICLTGNGNGRQSNDLNQIDYQ